jgi:hypothetical protein
MIFVLNLLAGPTLVAGIDRAPVPKLGLLAIHRFGECSCIDLQAFQFIAAEQIGVP